MTFGSTPRHYCYSALKIGYKQNGYNAGLKLQGSCMNQPDITSDNVTFLILGQKMLETGDWERTRSFTLGYTNVAVEL